MSKVRDTTTGGKRVRSGVPKLGPIIPQRLPPFIAYNWNNLEQNEQNVAGIFLIKSDGSDQHALILDPNAVEPSWSPRGTRILYTTGDWRGCIIWVADGSTQRPLISSGLPCWLGQPSWSPNGKKILYIRDGKNDNPEIRIANADGSHIHRVPHAGNAENASFSPDGRYILFDRYTVFGEPHIYLIRPNGSGLRQIATGGEGEDPSWSPDGKRIIYSCSFRKNPIILPPGNGGPAPSPRPPLPVPHAICEISRTHPRPRILYSVPTGDAIGGQTWSADGNTILFSDDANQIELLSPSGGTPVEITHTGFSGYLDW